MNNTGWKTTRIKMIGEGMLADGTSYHREFDMTESKESERSSVQVTHFGKLIYVFNFAL